MAQGRALTRASVARNRMSRSRWSLASQPRGLPLTERWPLFMQWRMVLPVLAVVAVVGLWWFTRFGELFYVSVRDGKCLVVRGRVPVSMLQEFREAVNNPTVKRGSIRAWKTEAGGELRCSGIDEGREQRMRNTFFLYPLAKVRQAPAIAKPTIGQLSGIAWLAWLFERSARGS